MRYLLKKINLFMKQIILQNRSKINNNRQIILKIYQIFTKNIKANSSNFLTYIYAKRSTIMTKEGLENEK